MAESIFVVYAEQKSLPAGTLFAGRPLWQWAIDSCLAQESPIVCILEPQLWPDIKALYPDTHFIEPVENSALLTELARKWPVHDICWCDYGQPKNWLVERCGDAANQHCWMAERLDSLSKKIAAEKNHYRSIAMHLIDSGVDVLDPDHFMVHGDLHCAAGVVIYPGCIFKGNVHIESGCCIETGCVITDTRIAQSCHIKAYSVLSDSTCEQQVTIGPYAHIQSSHIGNACTIGNYAEIKRSVLADSIKAKHFCYIGDGRIGSHCNIGAGTIFCNYNGRTKSQIVIGDYSFIGAHACLLAPLAIGSHALVGGGSVIANDIENGHWVVCRSHEQKVIKTIDIQHI